MRALFRYKYTLFACAVFCMCLLFTVAIAEEATHPETLLGNGAEAIILTFPDPDRRNDSSARQHVEQQIVLIQSDAILKRVSECLMLKWSETASIENPQATRGISQLREMLCIRPHRTERTIEILMITNDLPLAESIIECVIDEFTAYRSASYTARLNTALHSLQLIGEKQRKALGEAERELDEMCSALDITIRDDALSATNSLARRVKKLQNNLSNALTNSPRSVAKSSTDERIWRANCEILDSEITRLIAILDNQEKRNTLQEAFENRQEEQARLLKTEEELRSLAVQIDIPRKLVAVIAKPHATYITESRWP